MEAYPKPDAEGWEDKYRFAFAKDEVFSGFMTRIQSWSKEAEDIQKNEEAPDKFIV